MSILTAKNKGVKQAHVAINAIFNHPVFLGDGYISSSPKQVLIADTILAIDNDVGQRSKFRGLYLKISHREAFTRINIEEGGA